MMQICARTDANVLLCGETGVGKDLIANVIHRQSHRQGFPYVKVGCTLFPPQLIESELYGHEKGSFTGADQRRKGRFDLAEGGTLYLDDVDDIPLEHQSKLLRAIEEKVFERVGGTTPIKADVRIVASTKRNLLEKIAEGAFREDLYYRLDVLRVNIPPLRERLDDVPVLAVHLLGQISGGAEAAIDEEAMEILKRHTWPGNVRELAHTLERAYLVGGGRVTVERARRGDERHCRGRRRADGAQRRRLPGDDQSDGAGIALQRAAFGRRQQDGRRRRLGHEALDLPRQAREARIGINREG